MDLLGFQPNLPAVSLFLCISLYLIFSNGYELRKIRKGRLKEIFSTLINSGLCSLPQPRPSEAFVSDGLEHKPNYVKIAAFAVFLGL